MNKKFKINADILIKLAVGSLTAVTMLLILGSYNRGTKSLQDIRDYTKTINQNIESQDKRINKLNDEINDKLKKVDKLEKEVHELDKQIKEKIAYRDRLSIVIQKTSEQTKKPEADMLAKVIDEVTTEFNQKYGYPKNVAKMLAIISTESDFRNLDPNDAYAIGYAQVTPPCLEEVNKLAGWSYTMSDMYNAKNNLRVAWFVINRDMRKYGEDKAIVAYNQGYRHLTRSAKYCRTDKTSYLYKVNAKTEKYRELLRGGIKL